MSSNIVVNHMHCLVCGKAMSFDDERKTCSDKCQAQVDAQNKKRKQMMYFLYALMGLTLLLVIGGQFR